MQLEALGFDSFFQNAANGALSQDMRLARVLTVDRDSYLIQGADAAPVRGEVAGRLLFNTESAMNFPAVGDWVAAHYFDDDTFAVIQDILPRKTVLKRKTSGKKVAYQMIAANIDTAFIVQSLNGDFNLRRLERYLVMIHDGGIEPILLLSKSDLVASGDMDEKVRSVHAVMTGLPVLAVSSKSGAGIEDFKKRLTMGKTYCLVGSSGVGKTTLLNGLLGESAFETRSVRQKDGRGRHATSRRQLVFLANGAMIIDTPGMRELGNIGVETGLQDVFEDIKLLAAECRYRDCSHMDVKGCAVEAAVKAGTLPKDRYQSYIKLARESRYNEMSYLEKRRRDKAFGKMVKSVMKNKKNRP
jgi:ribosome biogenesis GTPase